MRVLGSPFGIGSFLGLASVHLEGREFGPFAEFSRIAISQKKQRRHDQDTNADG